MSLSSSNTSKVTIETHGCKLNQADSTVISNQFTDAGYVLSDDITEIDPENILTTFVLRTTVGGQDVYVHNE